MANNGHENLVPQNKRTKAEQRAIAKKGGQKSGEARRERKRLRDELLMLLSDGDTQEKMCLALIRQAQRGNTKAFEIVRDTVGEIPRENIEDDAMAPIRELVETNKEAAHAAIQSQTSGSDS